jgi:DNA repair exonuclease SbcCD ATPase subunit
MTLNLSIIELIVLFFCAISLGVVIHFFITSRRGLKDSPVETEKMKRNIDDWKLKYFNDIEAREKEVSELKTRLSETEENNRSYKIEVEELQRQQRRVQSELESVERAEPAVNKPNYIEQLRMAQSSLLEHNEKINQLLENIEVVKENEERQKLMEEENEELVTEVRELKYLLGQKESEIHNIKQKENLTREMTSMLDSAYSEFNTLQSKIQKLEGQLSSSKMVSLEYEDLKEAYQKTSRDYDDYKVKLQTLTTENQQLTLQLNEMEDKYRDANFQRQQLQKRVGYLEELNSDLQVMADANKKLEHQLRRIGELESMLNVVSEENQILKRQTNQ